MSKTLRLFTLFSAVLFVVLFAGSSTVAQKPELIVQTGHSNSVSSIAFSPDGRILASGSHDVTIKLWDVATGTELRSLKGHSNSVNSVAFSPDGKTLASGGADNTIKLWDVASGTELRSFKGHFSAVTSVAFSPDGKTLASGSYDLTINLWDVATGTELRSLEGHSHLVMSVAFSPDGKTLASGSADETIKLWDVASGTELRSFKGHSNSVNSVAFSPDGNRLASGSSDKTIKLWDVATGTELRSLQGRRSSHVFSVAFSPDGKSLASGSLYETNETIIKLWDAATGTELRSLEGDPDSVMSVAYSPDGKTLASGNGNGMIELWDVTSGTKLRSLKGHSNWVTELTFSSDGKTLASGSWANTGKLWDVANGRELRSLKGDSYSVYSGVVSSVAFTPDGKTLACGSTDDTIKLWDVASGRELRSLTGHSWVNSVTFSPDGNTLASGSKDGMVKLWDASTGTELHTLKGHSFDVNSVAFSPDGKTLASGGLDTTVKLWDVPSGTNLRTLRVYTWVTSVAFGPNGKILASGGLDNTVKLWDVSTGAELRTLKGHSASVHSVAFSSDGKTLASGSDDSTVKLWDVSTGAELRTLKGHSSVRSVAFSPNNKYLVSGIDTSVKVWEVSSGTELASLIPLNQNDWAVITPEGLFDGSPNAWSQILWRFNNNTFSHAPVEAFFSDFYHPGLLTDIFAGKHPKAPSDISQKDRRQPELRVSPTDPINSKVAARAVRVKIVISEIAADKDHSDGSGAQDVRLFRNGSLVRVWRGDVLKGQSSVTLEATVPIIAGENKFTAYAFNHENIKSSDAELTVTGADSLKRHGTAYVLAVGINEYANPQYKLNYAVADATDFATEVKRQQDSLKRYAKVEVISLLDVQATKANITQKLSELAKQVQPEDAVIVFFAGHGTAQGNQFYLIPHDLGYDGPRDNLSEAALQLILSHSVSDRDLEKSFEGIDAGQLLLVIDACNSGQALEAEEKRRGPMNSKGLAQLAYEKGMYVLTAAQSYQAAQEAAKFGHGFLTYALVEEGLKQGAADREPKNGSIDIREWLDFATDEVPKMQEQNSADALRGTGRLVIFVGDGSPLRNLERDKDLRDNIQRPRVFYRRELDVNPLVVGMPGMTPNH